MLGNFSNFILSVSLVVGILFSPVQGDGNRLAYLSNPSDPFYVHRNFPKLVTPQWVGEKGVEGVIVLSIDDMRDSARYETFLRPILNRLAAIDGRMPLSILTNSIHADDPQLQTWLQQGLSLDVHTIDHPCPCLRDRNFDAARSTYERCVDLMAGIPNNKPIAFRMPCCDSINSTSPRFWMEVFNRTTPDGNFLRMDSSVFHVFSADDASLPEHIATRPDGKSRFRHYLPFPSYVNTIEDYPYPYVIGRLCWEVPCLVPSDWEGQNIQGSSNPRTLADMKIALDATLLKRGATSLVFHPHGWIGSDQIVEFIDHAIEEHGERIKFLNFHEYQERLEDHLLVGQPLRDDAGRDNGVRLLDLNNDGFLDVVIGNSKLQRTRLWNPESETWHESDFPIQIVHADADGLTQQAGVEFFIAQKDGNASLLVRNEKRAGVWHFSNGKWVHDRSMLNGLTLDGQPIFTSRNGRDLGVRLRDLDNDGVCELIAGNKPGQVLSWDRDGETWKPLPFGLPPKTELVDANGKDAGMRFIDVDQDGHLDVLFSNETEFSLHLFSSLMQGWSRVAQQGLQADSNAIPPIVKNGANQGAWVSRNHVWWQNEATSQMPDLVERRSFNGLLGDQAFEPRTPEASCRSIEVAPEFQVELVAAEPLVQDPVAIDWGADGRLWVVEMGDYPLGVDGKGAPGGRVRILEDSTGDGRYDRSSLFAEGLNFPTDLMVWRKGVLITAAPHVWYLEDTDGDGRADLRESWFTGFGEGNQQHRVNGLRWGLDNWVYLANGDSGGKIRSVKTGETVDIQGRDLRIKPETGRIEATTGQTQHGRCCDSWGNWWGSSNSVPFMQYVLDEHYLQRNPFVTSPSLRQIDRSGQWGLFPVSRILSHYSGYQSPAAGQPSQFTSACGTMIYRDNFLGESLTGNLFVSEPVHNLIHRRVVNGNGIRKNTRKPPSEARTEFLRSNDSWFRPTTLRTGPDGCLWITDMYRPVIEHPEWIDDVVEKRLNLREGHKLGRIYRIVPQQQNPKPISDMTKYSVRQLIDQLGDSNGTKRDIAHRLLLWQKDSAVDDGLANTFTTSQIPCQRLAALCVLAGREKVSTEQILKGLLDSHPAIRRHSVRIAEQFFNSEGIIKNGDDDRVLRSHESAGSKNLELIVKAMARLEEVEQEPQVILQLACSLGEMDHPIARNTMGKIIAKHHGDTHVVAAALSSIQSRIAEVLAGIIQTEGRFETKNLPLQSLVRTSLGLGELDSVVGILALLMRDGAREYEVWQINGLADIDQVLRKAGQSLDLLTIDDQKRQWISDLKKYARDCLIDPETPRKFKAAALNLLSCDPDFAANDISLAMSLLSPQTPRDLQQSVLQGVGRLDETKALEKVLSGWPQYGPLTRDRLVGLYLQRPVSTRVLLESVEQGTIQPSDINLAYSQVLMAHPITDLSARAGELLQRQHNIERQMVIDRYLPVVRRGGISSKGKQHFDKTCSQCHRLAGEGHAVGPNLAALADLSPEFLTTHILDSARSVEDKYQNYIVLMNDGRQFTGLLQQETATSVTLLGQNSEVYALLKKEIEEEGFRRSALSMMPQGLETSLDPEALADLVAYVIERREPPKQFEGNQPQLVSAEKGARVLRLFASRAFVYGPTLVYEQGYGNLGFWQSEDDRGEWKMEVVAAGKYDVYLDWALANSPATNSYRLELGNAEIISNVESTGTWDRYRQKLIGTVDLKSGVQRVVLSPKGQLTDCLIDLREICIVPKGEQPPKRFLSD